MIELVGWLAGFALLAGVMGLVFQIAGKPQR
jgi:hypothetical protein